MITAFALKMLNFSPFKNVTFPNYISHCIRGGAQFTYTGDGGSGQCLLPDSDLDFAQKASAPVEAQSGSLNGNHTRLHDRGYRVDKQHPDSQVSQAAAQHTGRGSSRRTHTAARLSSACLRFFPAAS
ncbi:hypothetical protein ILYODFUR_013717 [Ilyodon furcidens]|uniref:Uncharacterized protein n=1 Tax=Ilyodon furcidens TaxID=33524 RepID=A0ABV0SXT7_9TELE